SLLSFLFFFFSSRRRHTRFSRDWSSDVCSSDLFVRDLLRLDDAVPANVHIVLTCRPERRHLLEAPASIPTLELPAFTATETAERSEERRVGKECRSRWSP